MTSGTRPRRRRLDPAEPRAEILAAARHLFGAGSYASVSTSDIAEAAGVARPLINHYFGGKRELYLEVVRQMMIVPAPVTEALPDTTMEQRLAIGVERWIEVVDRNRDAWLTVIGPEAAGRDPEIERIEREADEIAVHVREGCLNMPDPHILEIFDRVYVDQTPELVAQRAQYATYLDSFEGAH